MARILTFFLSCASVVLTAQSAIGSELEQQLFYLPDVRFEAVEDDNPKVETYRLFIRQPLDHSNPAAGHFDQQVLLTHHGFDRPVLMSTQGYTLFTGKNELEAILDANHVNVEHRFFGESTPEGKPWQYLTLENVTADLHRINQLMRKIYSGKFISTGISKGGQTTIFYRYFYPDDVAVSIPYVAPFNQGLEDKRIYDFLDTVGTRECRDHIKDFQIYLLQNETAALDKLRWYSRGAKITYDYLGSIERAYEYAVLEYSFSFWQSGVDCGDIPPLKNLDLDTALDHFLNVSSMAFFGDGAMETYASHYYQAATQMGYYGYDIRPFKKYLTQFKSNPLATFAPKSAGKTVYSNKLNEAAQKWLDEEGDNFLYIYGGSDTWSADRVIPTDETNSQVFILPETDHYRARIRNMSRAEQERFAAYLREWTGLEVDISVL